MGHLDVHQDEVIGTLLQELEDLAAVGSRAHGVSLLGQHPLRHFLIDEVVLGQKDVEGLLTRLVQAAAFFRFLGLRRFRPVIAIIT